MTHKDTQVSYLTVRQIAAKYKFLTESGWRWLIRDNKEFNKTCVRRLGRKILVNEQKVVEFIEKSKG